MHVVGLDIGGANLKASDGLERSRSRPFAIWRAPERLPEELRRLLEEFGPWDALAVTMTAELADCFRTKREGVDRILSAVEQVAGGREVHVWQTGGEFVSPDEARELTPLVAAANWHALATWGARMVPAGTGLLIDIGSTTTDVIPIEAGMPMPQGRTDVERLLSGELVYTGVKRTPLCALAATAPLRGADCPLATELFATTRDVYLLLEDLPEQPEENDTADGRPATREHAHSRIAHMLCCDGTELSEDEMLGICRDLADRQVTTIAAAIRRVSARLPSPPRSILLSGEGEFLARRGIKTAGFSTDLAISLWTALGPEHSTAACAFALARLARERLD